MTLFEEIVLDIVGIFLTIYLTGFIAYWQWRILFKIMPKPLADHCRESLMDIFRFICWLTGVRYKK